MSEIRDVRVVFIQNHVMVNAILEAGVLEGNTVTEGPVCRRQFNHLPYLMGPVFAGLFTLPLSYIYVQSSIPEVRRTLIAISLFVLAISLGIHFWRLHENSKRRFQRNNPADRLRCHFASNLAVPVGRLADLAHLQPAFSSLGLETLRSRS
ncbi:hypothetical protein [Asticcacaulis taihuensis]|uniref:hypothetical protein n=1 Tax=Asticcacaulis taihuensis TaxID=260084 RepID=UPI003F7B7DF0